MGVDCDDSPSGGNVHENNKCGKCEAEPKGEPELIETIDKNNNVKVYILECGLKVLLDTYNCADTNQTTITLNSKTCGADQEKKITNFYTDICGNKITAFDCVAITCKPEPMPAACATNDCYLDKNTCTWIVEDQTTTSTWYLDYDKDGYGNPYELIHSSKQPKGYVDNDTDCDDTDASKTTNCADKEECSNIDEAINSISLGARAALDLGSDIIVCAKKEIWYLDQDNDGFHKENSIKEKRSSPGPGYKKGTSQGVDCNDDNPNIKKCEFEDKDCEQKAINRGFQVDEILNDPKLTNAMAFLRSRIMNEPIERGFSIERKQDGSIAPTNSNSGEGNGVKLDTNVPNKNIIATVHSHPRGTESGSSPTDLYHLINTYISNSDYTQAFNIAQDGTEYAMVVDDPRLLREFVEKYPFEENVNVNNEFIPIPNESKIEGEISLHEYYRGVSATLLKQGYEVSDIHVSVLVLVLEHFKTGIKLLKKDSDEESFKELSGSPRRDQSGNILKNSDGFTLIKIEKCK